MFYDRKMRRTDDKSHFMTYYKDSGYYTAPENASLYMCKLIKTMANEIEKMTNIPRLEDGRGYIAVGYTWLQHGFQPLGYRYENRVVSLFIKLYSDHRGSEQPSEFIEDDMYSYNRLYFVIELLRDKYAWTHELTGVWYMDRMTRFSPLHEMRWGLKDKPGAGFLQRPEGDKGEKEKIVWTEGLEEQYSGDFTRLPVRPNQKRFV